MVRACRPDDIGVSVSYPLPGTRFYARVLAELGSKRNWIDSNDLETMYHATYGPEFYRVLHQAVHAEFRMRKMAGVVTAARRPWMLRPAHARVAASAAMNALKLPMLRWQVNQLSQGPLPSPVRSTTSVSV
jgi:anaerobic magnesium-protoporphyrin IX monomethyl ester cyclase